MRGPIILYVYRNIKNIFHFENCWKSDALGLLNYTLCHPPLKMLSRELQSVLGNIHMWSESILHTKQHYIQCVWKAIRRTSPSRAVTFYFVSDRITRTRLSNSRQAQHLQCSYIRHTWVWMFFAKWYSVWKQHDRLIWCWYTKLNLLGTTHWSASDFSHDRCLHHQFISSFKADRPDLWLKHWCRVL